MSGVPGLARGLATALLLVVAGGFEADVAGAQEVRVEVGSAHYVGDRIAVRVEATGFEEEPTPTLEISPPARGRLEFQGVSPNVSTQIAIVGGRLTQSREVKFLYEYRYTGLEPGPVVLGPFRVSQGSVVRQAPAVRLELRAVPQSDRARVTLRLPKEPVYVGARVPVVLEFWLDQELRKNLQSYTLSVPLFDRGDSFRFIDPPRRLEGADTQIDVQTAAGSIRLRGVKREEVVGGRRYLVVSMLRTLIPLRAGDLEVEPAHLLVEEGTSWRRDFFAGRRATRVRRWRATDTPRRLLVKALPKADAPGSFAGAVGAGFSLEVSADRTVVQVGDPITLTFALRGEGLETAALPPLDSEGLLPADDFRVPEGELAGSLGAGGAKRFTAVVRVLDESVVEIPALEYSWFDPGRGSYQTARSRPIALSVRAAEVIGAADVETREEAPAPDPSGSPADVADAAFLAGATGAAPERSRALPLSGADLAIVRDTSLLLRDSERAWGGAWLPAGLYAGSFFAVALAWVDRRRRDVDPRLVRRRALVRAARQRIEEAAKRPAREGAGELAAAVRALLAEIPDASSPALDALLGECDARRYAPVTGPNAEGGAELPLEASLWARAHELADRIEETMA